LGVAFYAWTACGRHVWVRLVGGERRVVVFSVGVQLAVGEGFVFRFSRWPLGGVVAAGGRGLCGGGEGMCGWEGGDRWHVGAALPVLCEFAIIVVIVVDGIACERVVRVGVEVVVGGAGAVE
jgi:hypothetical protein